MYLRRCLEFQSGANPIGASNGVEREIWLSLTARDLSASTTIHPTSRSGGAKVKKTITRLWTKHIVVTRDRVPFLFTASEIYITDTSLRSYPYL